MATRSPHDRLRAFALSLPGAWEDFPWGDRVVKAGKKIFVFLGRGDSAPATIAVKLVESHPAASAVPGAVPTGYGLGRAGWVTVPIDGDGSLPVGVAEDWIEESYRLVALKGLVRQLDDVNASRSGGPSRPGGGPTDGRGMAERRGPTR